LSTAQRLLTVHFFFVLVRQPRRFNWSAISSMQIVPPVDEKARSVIPNTMAVIHRNFYAEFRANVRVAKYRDLTR
jgi:hypothetical protein